MDGILQKLIEANINRPPTSECWYWCGKLRKNGYGFIYLDGRTLYAHRIAYEAFKEPLKPGLQIDHLCRIRSCVNPQHLEQVTRKENILRGVGATALNKRKTICKNGHPLNEKNTYIRPDGNRHCRRCNTENQRIYDARKRQL